MFRFGNALIDIEIVFVCFYLVKLNVLFLL